MAASFLSSLKPSETDKETGPGQRWAVGRYASREFQLIAQKSGPTPPALYPTQTN